MGDPGDRVERSGIGVVPVERAKRDIEAGARGVVVSQASPEAVSDGQLTTAEYLAAVEREVQCIRSALPTGNVSVSDVIVRGDGDPSYTVAVDYSGEGFPTEAAKREFSARVDLVTEDCARQESFLLQKLRNS